MGLRRTCSSNRLTRQCRATCITATSLFTRSLLPAAGQPLVGAAPLSNLPTTICTGTRAASISSGALSFLQKGPFRSGRQQGLIRTLWWPIRSSSIPRMAIIDSWTVRLLTLWVSKTYRSSSSAQTDIANSISRVADRGRRRFPPIAEACGDLRRVRADRLDDLTPVGDDQINGGSHTIDHHVHKKSGCQGGWASEDPSAAHFAGGVVKGDVAIAAFPDFPAEDAFVKLGRARNIGSRHLDVTDLAVCKRRRHVVLLRAQDLALFSSRVDGFL